MSNKNNERAEVRIMAEIKLVRVEQTDPWTSSGKMVKGLPSKTNRISR